MYSKKINLFIGLFYNKLRIDLPERWQCGLSQRLISLGLRMWWSCSFLNLNICCSIGEMAEWFEPKAHQPWADRMR